MAQYQVTFHVESPDESGAQVWRDRANQILTHNKEFLVSSDGNGGWCPGHVFPPSDQPAPQPMTQSVSQSTGRLLGMGPRE